MDILGITDGSRKQKKGFSEEEQRGFYESK